MAQALFDEGRALMRDGSFALACPKLEESYRHDPALGTKLNLALCHEKEGKTATAWSEFEEARSEARERGDEKREAFASEHIAQLSSRLSRVTVSVAPDNEVPGLEVRRDGTPLKKPSWGSAVPMDPGDYVFSATAPGYEPWEVTLRVAPGPWQEVVEIPRLLPAAATSSSKMPAPATRIALEPQDHGGGNAQRIAGYTIGGIGVAAVIVGAAFGVAAIREEDTSDKLCPADEAITPRNGDTWLCSNPEALQASEDAQLDALLSNVFLFSGIGLAAVGLVVVLTAPDDPEPMATLAPLVAPGAAGAVLRGRF